MRSLTVVLALVALLLTGVGSWAHEPGALAPQIHAAHHFLIAWGHQRWDEAMGIATDTVVLRTGDQEYTVDVAGGTTEVMLIFPFRGLSTVRVEGKVKGVTVDHIVIKADGMEKEGRGTLTLEEQDDGFIVTGVSVE
ncbi:MAG: hypothetical protein ACE5FK_04080 [Candidatus Methylomirabilia bacterium]